MNSTFKLSLLLFRPLKDLDLQENNLTEIPKWMVNMNKNKKMRYVRRINLSNNRINKIPLGVFKDLLELISLDLHFNQLTEINIFSDLGKEINVLSSRKK